MGRIKTTQVKHTGKEIFEKYKDSFTTDFTKNKQLLNERYEINSRKMANVVAGYITKLKKHEQTM